MKSGDPGSEIPEVPTKPEDIDWLERLGCLHPREECTRECLCFINNTCPLS